MLILLSGLKISFTDSYLGLGGINGVRPLILLLDRIGAFSEAFGLSKRGVELVYEPLFPLMKS